MNTCELSRLHPVHRLSRARGRQQNRNRPWRNARIKAPATRHRTALAAALSAALIVLASGCGSAGHHSSPGSGTSRAATPSVTSALGRLSVHTADIDLTITSAVVHLDRSGDGTLSMSVRNGGAVPEHLGMVATPDEGRGVLVGRRSAEGNGSLSTAGILLLSGTTVAFHGKRPRVELHHVRGITAGHTLPVSLQFAVAGLVRLQVRVASS
ncbi:MULTISPECIES: hypothetical protein [unclassified Streptomyces]|uniref:hypothetical protein n=1 Tax=unclassified Streptomyces TaxID=2593676 RepID=UPI002E2E27E2|nr:hypothetical protein [Streptomyces sp. NBC_00228]